MRVLLVRLRLIGDVVFTTPLVRALRRHMSDVHLTYVVEPAAEPVLRGNPHLDELLVLPRPRGWNRVRDDLRAGRALRRRRFDVAIDLHGGPRSAWLTWASGAPVRIGYTIPGRSWMYTHRVRRAPDPAPRHSVENQWDLLGPLGIGPCEPARDPVEMGVEEDADRRVARWLEGQGVGPRNHLVVMHVSAGNPFRRWPADSFAALAVLLARTSPDRRVIITSGPSDRAAAARVAAQANARFGQPPPILAAADLDLAELRALIARSGVFIGGDSGPAHIASTTCTPIVQLLGPTLPERSRPWRDPRWFSETIDAGPLPCRPCNQRRCVPGDFRCLTSIGPERVAAAAERALARAAEAPA